jgi:hypothetical protein
MGYSTRGDRGGGARPRIFFKILGSKGLQGAKGEAARAKFGRCRVSSNPGE